MADNRTVFRVEFEDGGTIRAKTNDTKAFNKEAGKAVSAAKDMSNTYDQARASGGTGAAGRDFANQAQGLGGLVRVYATFAANIFAVSAAFNALSNAADTTNLVKGLDQLGASSGKNLGTLSKRIVEATDSAVSLREAMTATAQASSAGMSSTDILKLAKGAKQASQALGIDMSDALSRLSRGITKIEPELLDELGIFVRVDKAVQDYATSIGKPVTALTEFERRAAFSSAVLTQLNTKFGELNIDSNPYNQLLASLKNVASAGLEVVNKVLGPLVSLLAQSPTALLGVMGLIGLTLLKQAIPALSSWRENLERSRDATSEAATETRRLYDEYRSGVIEKDMSKQAVAFKSASGAVLTHVAALKELDGINKRTSLSKGITKFADNPNAENAQSLKVLADQRVTDINAQKAKGVSEERALAIDKELAGISKLKPAMDDLTKSTTQLNTASSAYKGVSTGYFSLAASYERIDRNARAAAVSVNIVSNSVANAQFGALNALVMSFREINNALANRSLTNVGAFFTAIKSGAAIAMVSVNTLVAGMAGILNIIGIVTAFGALMASIFTKNSKEASAFSSAMDDLTSSFANVDRTLAVISKKDPLGQLNSESFQARANALGELNDKLVDSTKGFAALSAATTNWLDTSTNWAKGFFFGTDAASTISNQMAEAIPKAMALLESSTDKAALSRSLLSALGVTSLEKAGIAEKLREALVSGNTGLITKYTKAMGDASRATNSAASDTTQFSNSLVAALKTNQEYVNSFNLSDPLAKFGIDLLQVSTSMENVRGSSESSQKALLELMGDTKKMGLLGTEFATSLLTIRDGYQAGSSEVQKYTTDLEAQRAKLEELIALRDKPRTFMEGAVLGASLGLLSVGPDRDKAGKDAIAAAARIKETQAAAKVAGDKFKALNVDAQKIITDGMHKAFVSGSALIEQSLKNVQAQAAITVAKGATGLLTGTSALSAESKLAEASYKIQVEAINVNESLILSQARLNNTFEVGNKLKQMELIASDKTKGQGSKEYAAAETSYNAGLAAGKILESGNIGAAVSAAKEAAPGSESALIGQELRGIATAIKGTAAARTTARAGMSALALQQAGAMPGAVVTETTAVKLAQEKAINTTLSERVDINKDILGFASVEMVAAKNKLDISNLTNDSSLTAATLQGTIAGLQAQQVDEGAKLLRGELSAQEVLVTTTKLNAAKVDLKKLENLELKGLLTLQKAIEESAARDLVLAQSKRTVVSEALTNQLDIESAILAKRVESGSITGDQQASEEQSDKLSRIRLDTTNKLTIAQDALTKLTNEYNSSLLLIDADNMGALDAKYDSESAALRNNITVIEQKGAASLRVAEISRKNSERETAYASLFNSSVSTMTDSLVDFAFTGKQSFTDMISSMLMDLVKLEMRMLAVKAIQQSGGASSLISAGMKYFTGSGGFTNDAGGTELAGSLGFAKGGSFGAGAQAFAKGGTFTNSVVSSPTLFKFAKGTGMMGEAGPEAIMPLKRNANGVLGVEAGGGGSSGETNVVVHNYGPSKADTKRSVDSRGNTTIEVTIGDAVAGEIRRSGSPAQESIKSTFGRQPQLIRR